MWVEFMFCTLWSLDFYFLIFLPQVLKILLYPQASEIPLNALGLLKLLHLPSIFENFLLCPLVLEIFHLLPFSFECLFFALGFLNSPYAPLFFFFFCSYFLLPIDKSIALLLPSTNFLSLFLWCLILSLLASTTSLLSCSPSFSFRFLLSSSWSLHHHWMSLSSRLSPSVGCRFSDCLSDGRLAGRPPMSCWNLSNYYCLTTSSCLSALSRRNAIASYLEMIVRKGQICNFYYLCIGIKTNRSKGFLCPKIFF